MQYILGQNQIIFKKGKIWKKLFYIKYFFLNLALHFNQLNKKKLWPFFIF